MNAPLFLIRSILVRVPAPWWLGAFAVALAADLAAVGFDADAARWASKPALTLLLLGFLIVSTPPGRSPSRLFGSGLLWACAADLALLVDGTPAFLTGMGLFAIMQVTYVVAFARMRALPALRRRWAVPACYLAFWLGAMVVLGPRLGALAVPVAVYGLLLVSMAAAASGLGAVSAVGGLLFVLSDLLLGAGVAGFELPLRDQAVMATYGLAQLLLVLGVVKSRPAASPSETAAL